MWGSAVNESQSFLGILESKLARHPVGAEVINAGVVGYSALQEYLLFDLFLQGFAPDFLIVNFCQNDKLPSEDPHGMVREAYLDYLHRTVAEQGSRERPGMETDGSAARILVGYGL